MKLSHKILTLAVTVLVFIASTGMTINLHFCANNLEQVSLQQQNNSSCCDTMKQKKENVCKEKKEHKNCTEQEKSSCCKDKQIKTKTPVKADNPIIKKETSFLQPFIFLKSFIFSFLSFDTEDKEDDKKPDYSLFPLLKQGLYILLGQFRN